MQFQQNLNATIQDLKMHVGQLVDTVSQIQSVGSENFSSQTISNPKGGVTTPLLDHLKYVYLDNHQYFLVIIANNLNREQEEKLLNVLHKHKKAIGWMLADLPGINPFIYMHKILLEEEARSIRQQQRRLNLTILDIVKKKVTRLLAVEIIYPISDS
ncbi:hypothetical protein CR513_19833, partial [Mucuna pruriens]